LHKFISPTFTWARLIVASIDQEILKVFFYDVWCAVVMHFSAWSGEIRTDIETITAGVLQTVWNELVFHVDVRRITKGAHIEHL